MHKTRARGLGELGQRGVKHHAGDFVAVAGVVQGKGEDVSGAIDHDFLARSRTGGDTWFPAGHGGTV